MAVGLKNKRVIVVGGGLAGLACAIKLAEDGVNVDLFSMVPVKRSHSVCAQGGINATNEIARQQGYSEWMHFDETALGGDFLADQPPVLEMCNWAPRIIDLLDRMGVPFNRTPEGQRSLRLFGGSLFKRTFYAGATTGQQLLYALDEQTRRYEAEGKVAKYEFWEFLWPVIADGQCVGIVAQDMRTMEIKAFRGDAVVMATGGNGLIFGKSTMSVICTGGAASRCYQAGARLGNPEFVQVHPTAIPGEDKCRLISESARGEGGRVWVPKKQGDARPPNSIPESERFYFLEERYPKYGNLVPRDIATREIFQVCTEMGLGVGGGNMVYLDLRDEVKKQGRDKILNKLEGILEIYEKFVGTDPLDEPMKIFPAVHYTMGGLWTGFKKDEKSGGLKFGDPSNMMTNIPGLYAMGEVNFGYHGANRLGANSLLSCIFDGLFGGTCIRNYITDTIKTAAADVPESSFEQSVKHETERQDAIVKNTSGDENPYRLWQEMGREMTENCTVVRHNERLERTLAKCQDWKARYKRAKLSDTGMWTNQNLSFTRALRDMIIMADAILQAALLRNESRGAHYKPEFAERDDAQFLKATIAMYDTTNDRPQIDYAPVDTSLVTPRARTYGKKPDAPASGASATKPTASDTKSAISAGAPASTILNPTTRHRIVSATILCIILVLAAVLRFDRARADGLTFDEIWHLELSTGRGSLQITLPTNTLIENAPALTSLKDAPPIWNVWTRMERVVHPPLFVTVLRVWRELFGESDLAAKSLSIVSSLIAIGFLYDAIRVHTSVGAARWAALIFALAPAQIYIDQQVRGYAMAQMWACAVLATIIRIEKLGLTRSRTIRLVLFASFLALTHYFGIFALLAMVAYVIVRFDSSTRRRTLFALVSAGAIFTVAWGPFMWRMRDTVSTMADPWLREPSASTLEHFGLTLGRALAAMVRQIADPANPMFHWPLIVGAMLIVISVLSLMLRRRTDLLVWFFWLGGTLGAVILLDLVRHTRQLQFPRYTSLAAPAIVALIASVRPSKHILPIIACVFAFVSYSMAFTREGEPDWRQLGTEIDARIKPGEPLIFYAGTQVPWYHEILFLSASHYSHAFPRPVVRLTQPPSAELPTEHAWIVSGPLDRPIEQLVPGARMTEQYFLPEFALLTRIQISRPNR